jgi:excisionase family DNA binding protein
MAKTRAGAVLGTAGPRATYTVDEAAELLGISRHTAYEGCRSGQIPCIWIGKRMLVPGEALGRMLRGEAVQAELPLGAE